MKNHLNLGDILTGAPVHVILRMSEDFPNYVSGKTDVDILCLDLDEMEAFIYEQILGPAEDHYPDSGMEIKKYIGADYRNHMQLDFYYADTFDLKFDLYDEYISEDYSLDALRTRTEVQRGEYFYSVPLSLLNGISKCHEFLRYQKCKYRHFYKYHHILSDYEKDR